MQKCGICHSAPSRHSDALAEESQKDSNNRDISAFSKPQYDNLNCHSERSEESQQDNIAKLKHLLASLPTPPENGWEKVKLEKILSTIQTGKRPKGGAIDDIHAILSLGGEHIDNTNGYIDLSNPKFVPLEFFEKYEKRDFAIPKQNDILLCKDGALTGKIALVRNEFNNKKAMINEHIFLLRTQDINTQKYIFYFLHSQDGQDILKSKITGSAQGGLNRDNLLSIQIPLPLPKAQESIIKSIQVCEGQIKTLELNKQKLFNAKNEILEHYLSGFVE